MRIKVLAAREAAIQEIVSEAKTKLREVSKNPTTYKKLLTDLLVQVRESRGHWTFMFAMCMVGAVPCHAVTMP